MNYKLITLYIFLGLAHSVYGQPYTADFTGGYVDDAFSEVNTSGTSFVLKNPDSYGGQEFLNYHTAGVAPTGFEQVFLNYRGSSPTTPNNSQDFSVSLDVSNYAVSGGLTATANSMAQIGLSIYDADFADTFKLYNGAYSFNGAASSDIIFYDNTNFSQAFNFSSAATLLTQFSAATQTFTFSFATPANASFQSFATLNINGTGTTSGNNFVEDWDMASGTSFDINIYAGSNVAIVDASAGFGYMNADNFSLNVVPEPSAFAALLGVFTMAAVILRRRR